MATTTMSEQAVLRIMAPKPIDRHDCHQCDGQARAGDGNDTTLCEAVVDKVSRMDHWPSAQHSGECGDECHSKSDDGDDGRLGGEGSPPARRCQNRCPDLFGGIFAAYGEDGEDRHHELP
jgi:hypothetical protein